MPTHFRVDWSRTHCVITTEGKNDPGLALSNTMATPNHLHAKVRDQLVASFTSDRVIVMPPNFAKIAAGTRLADVSDDLLRTGLSTIAPKDGNLETFRVRNLSVAKAVKSLCMTPLAYETLSTSKVCLR